MGLDRNVEFTVELMVVVLVPVPKGVVVVENGGGDEDVFLIPSSREKVSR